MAPLKALLNAAALMAACSTGAHAQHTVRIATEVERIENPLLSNVSPGGVNVVRVIADYAYVLETERTRSRFSAGALLERSSDTVLLASRNYPSLGYTWAYNWPTADLELRANVAEAATRNTQFEELGRVVIDARERTTVTGAIWNKELTERTRLTVDVANNRVTYDSPLLESYREVELTTRFSWEESERSTYFFEPGFGRLTPTGPGVDSTLSRWVVGTRRELSPQLAMTALGGQARTRGLRPATELVGSLQLAFTGNRWTSGAEWTRDVRPIGSASGYVTTDVLGARAGYQIGEGTTLSAGTSRSRWGGPTGGVGHVSNVALEKVLTDRWMTMLSVEDRRFRDLAGVSGRGWGIRAGLVYAYSGL